MVLCNGRGRGEDRYKIVVGEGGQRLSHNREHTRKVNNEISSMCSPGKYVPQGSDQRRRRRNKCIWVILVCWEECGWAVVGEGMKDTWALDFCSLLGGIYGLDGLPSSVTESCFGLRQVT